MAKRAGFGLQNEIRAAGGLVVLGDFAMTFSSVENVFWAVGVITETALTITLYKKRVYRTAPIFWYWILLTLISALVLFFIGEYSGPVVYAVSFYTMAAVDSVLQLTLISEFASQSLGQRETWTGEIKRLLAVAGCAAFLVAATLSLKSHPSAQTWLDVVFVRADLFVAILVFLLAITVLAVTYESGRLWRLSELYRFSGFVVWAAICALTDTLHLYKIGGGSHFDSLEIFRSCSTLVVAVYWIITAFLPEYDRLSSPSDRLQELSAFYSKSLR